MFVIGEAEVEMFLSVLHVSSTKQEQGDDTSIKIADFGFAKKVPRPNCLRTLCGTAQYVAPEVLELKDTGYDTRADMWSVGVVVYSE